MPTRLIKSPLRYPGGKSRAAELISRVTPDFNEFREPFVGGGSVFFHLKQKRPDKKFWINDRYDELFTFWTECQKNVAKVVRQVKAWREKYPQGKKLHRFLVENRDSFDNVQRASAFFVFNRITFSGTTESGGYSELAFKGRFTESSIERLKQSAPLLKDTQMTNQDYEALMKEPGKDVFIFLDPPYYSATKSALYGKNGDLHKSFDHERFAKAVRSCKHKLLITYDDSSYIRKLFSFAHIEPWDLAYGMRNVVAGSSQKGKELFISNYLLPQDALPRRKPVKEKP